jgi:hypothetical protein
MGAMKQATHGVEIQLLPKEIKAVEFCIERSKIDDITADLQGSIEEDHERARTNPGSEIIARMFCNHSYYVGLQTAWESFEFERMRPEGNELPE